MVKNQVLHFSSKRRHSENARPGTKHPASTVCSWGGGGCVGGHCEAGQYLAQALLRGPDENPMVPRVVEFSTVGGLNCESQAPLLGLQREHSPAHKETGRAGRQLGQPRKTQSECGGQ